MDRPAATARWSGPTRSGFRLHEENYEEFLSGEIYGALAITWIEPGGPPEDARGPGMRVGRPGARHRAGESAVSGREPTAAR